MFGFVVLQSDLHRAAGGVIHLPVHANQNLATLKNVLFTRLLSPQIL